MGQNDAPAILRIPKGSSELRMSGFSFEPQNLEEAIKFAHYISNSGMVPEAYEGNAGAVLVAIQMGADVGLKPLQAIQGIAVVGKIPALWGDTLLAVVRKSPLCKYVKEWWEDDPTNGLTAFCESVRVEPGKDEEPRTTTFSYKDAQTGQLLGKPAWKVNTKRMLQMRARAFCLRDLFADVLKGLQVVEEVVDFQDMRNVSPAPPPAPEAAGTTGNDKLLAMLDPTPRDSDAEGNRRESVVIQEAVNDLNAVADGLAAQQAAAQPSDSDLFDAEVEKLVEAIGKIKRPEAQRDFLVAISHNRVGLASDDDLRALVEKSTGQKLFLKQHYPAIIRAIMEHPIQVEP